jgi:hypothetical protein
MSSAMMKMKFGRASGSCPRAARAKGKDDKANRSRRVMTGVLSSRDLIKPTQESGGAP